MDKRKVKVGSGQRKLAKRYKDVSVICGLMIAILIYFLYRVGLMWLGLVLGAVAVLMEGIVLRKIGFLVSAPVPGGKSRLVTKLDLIMYLTLGLLVMELAFVLLG